MLLDASFLNSNSTSSTRSVLAVAQISLVKVGPMELIMCSTHDKTTGSALIRIILGKHWKVGKLGGRQAYLDTWVWAGGWHYGSNFGCILGRAFSLSLSPWHRQPRLPYLSVEWKVQHWLNNGLVPMGRGRTYFGSHTNHQQCLVHVVDPLLPGWHGANRLHAWSWYYMHIGRAQSSTWMKRASWSLAEQRQPLHLGKKVRGIDNLTNVLHLDKSQKSKLGNTKEENISTQ